MTAAFLGAVIAVLPMMGAFAVFGAVARNASYWAGRTACETPRAATIGGIRGGALFGLAFGLVAGAIAGALYPDELVPALAILIAAAFALLALAVCFGVAADLASRWQIRVHIDCPACGGRGGYQAQMPGGQEALWLTCRACSGSGRAELD
jgi:hypothetical protein